jgi:outer membrane protein assembly factor BamC
VNRPVNLNPMNPMYPMHHKNHLQRTLSIALVCAFGLGACAVIEEDKINYKSVSKGNSLEIPPDLVQLSRDNRYQLPGGSNTASGFEAGKSTQTVAATAPLQIGDVSIERAGNQRWLVINRAPEKVWPLLRDFWTENGFLLTTDEQSLGIIETDWAENRAKLPQDFIRASLGKLLDSIYSTGERDKFRTRVERNSTGTTEIYVSHRGMVEKYQSGNAGTTIWTPRPADPELEAEFLRRMMVKMGVTEEQSKKVATAATAVQTSKIVTQDGQSVVQINEAFDRAWRRVGLALDRTGFTVEDRDRAQGLYFVRYVAPNPDKKEPGFFGKLFGNEANTPVLKYRILVKNANATQTVVSVLNATGAAATGGDVQNILKVLSDDLK